VPTADDAPLGVFDSGLGGLTVVRALRAAAPSERIVYLGDTARVPYGTRSPDTVVRYARSCARVLTARGVKALVVACNTVSAVALEMLRAELDLPVLGVIEPGARAALAAAESTPGGEGDAHRIGVLGTPGTIASGAYPRAVSRLSTRYEVVAQAAPLLVPLVEEGWVEGDVPRLAIRRYVEPLVRARVRVIVLGCTHYPALALPIGNIRPDKVAPGGKPGWPLTPSCPGPQSLDMDVWGKQIGKPCIQNIKACSFWLAGHRHPLRQTIKSLSPFAAFHCLQNHLTGITCR
jgi:glutamate racemase